MLPIRTAQHIVLPSNRQDVALIGLDGFGTLEQEHPNLEAYRDPESLLVSNNPDSMDIVREPKPCQILVKENASNRLWLESLESYRTTVRVSSS